MKHKYHIYLSGSNFEISTITGKILSFGEPSVLYTSGLKVSIYNKFNFASAIRDVSQYVVQHEANGQLKTLYNNTYKRNYVGHGDFNRNFILNKRDGSPGCTLYQGVITILDPSGPYNLNSTSSIIEDIIPYSVVKGTNLIDIIKHYCNNTQATNAEITASEYNDLDWTIQQWIRPFNNNYNLSEGPIYIQDSIEMVNFLFRLSQVNTDYSHITNVIDLLKQLMIDYKLYLPNFIIADNIKTFSMYNKMINTILLDKTNDIYWIDYITKFNNSANKFKSYNYYTRNNTSNALINEYNDNNDVLIFDDSLLDEGNKTVISNDIILSNYKVVKVN